MFTSVESFIYFMWVFKRDILVQRIKVEKQGFDVSNLPIDVGYKTIHIIRQRKLFPFNWYTCIKWEYTLYGYRENGNSAKNAISTVIVSILNSYPDQEGLTISD